MSVSKIVSLMLVSTLVFTAVGGIIGFGLGRFVPNYYRQIVRDGRAPDFDPVAFGIGQGVTQGMTAGIVIGLLLVVALSWLDSRPAHGKSSVLSQRERGEES